MQIIASKSKQLWLGFELDVGAEIELEQVMLSANEQHHYSQDDGGTEFANTRLGIDASSIQYQYQMETGP